MKVEMKKAVGQTPAEEIGVGDCFTLDGGYYIMTDILESEVGVEEDYLNAVNLISGEFTVVKSNTFVTPIEAAVVVK